MLAHKIGRHIIPVVEKFTELGLILEYAAQGRRAAADRHARQAGGARRRPLAGVRRLPLEVRPDGRRKSARASKSSSSAACRTASSSCTSISAARSPTFATSRGALNEAARVYVELHARRRGPRVPRRRRRAGRRLRRLADRLRIAASTTRCRNTPTTSSFTSRASATRRACRIRRSSPRAGGPSSPTTACWSSTCWASPGFDESDVPQRDRRRRRAADRRSVRHRISDLTTHNLLESYHDAQQALDMAMNLFNGGYLPHRSAQPRRELCSGRSAARCCKLVPATGLRARRSAGARRAALGHLLLQLLAVPVDARQLGDQAAVSRDADPSAERAADAPAVLGDITCDSDGKIDQFIDRRDVQAHAARCTRSTASPTTWARSCSAPIRKSSATCTTCSATPTPCTSASTAGDVVLETVIKGDTVREVLDYVEFDAEC